VTYIVAPSLTGYPPPGVTWLPGQWAAMMSGQAADLTAEVFRRRDGLVCDIPKGER
jgi:hypothetical protein